MPETISVHDVIVNGEPTIAPDTDGGGTGTAYTTGDPASTTINDTDYVPLSDANGNRKKSLWSNIVNKLKSIFNPPIADIVNVYGAKNLIPYPYYDTTKTRFGVTYTDNGDGTVTVTTGTGTSTSAGAYNLNHPSEIGTLVKLDKNKTYIVSDVDKVGVYGSYALGCRYYAEGVTPSTSNGTNISLNSSNNWQAVITDAVYAYVYIYVWGNKSVPDVTFKPMLRLASIEDDTYVPYAPINRDLMSYKVNGELGAKNLLPYPYEHTTKVEAGITWTDNGDGTITANGTATSDTAFNLNYCWNYNKTFDMKGIPWKVTGQPDGVSTNVTFIQTLIKTSTSSSVSYGNVTDNNGVISSPSNTAHLGLRIIIKNGATVSNLVFKPMIRRVEDTDPTWQPYAMTNKQLTDDKLSKSGGTVTGTLVLSKTTDASGTANNSPALIVGGTASQLHLEFDSNEIMAKSNGTTPATLALNNDGGAVKINGKVAARHTATPTSGYPLVADGTDGGIKTIQALPVSNGGTGDTTLTANGVLIGNGTNGVKSANSKSGALYSTGDGEMPVFGILPVAQGGSGHGTINANAVLLGNGTSAFKNIATANGAFYATSANGQPVFGTLPVGQGGTGATTIAGARNNLDVPAKGDLNNYALKSGAQFTGDVNVKASLSVTDGTDYRGFKLGKWNNTYACINTTGIIQSNYGVLELTALNNSNGVSVRGASLSVTNYANSAYAPAYASAFTVPSSVRYKENIKEMTEEKARHLLNIEVVTFDYKSDSKIAEEDDRFNKVGVIAEETIKHCPEVVTYKEVDEKKLPDSVDYAKFVPYLIKIVQMQDEKIKELENIIKGGRL